MPFQNQSRLPPELAGAKKPSPSASNRRSPSRTAASASASMPVDTYAGGTVLSATGVLDVTPSTRSEACGCERECGDCGASLSAQHPLTRLPIGVRDVTPTPYASTAVSTARTGQPPLLQPLSHGGLHLSSAVGNVLRRFGGILPLITDPPMFRCVPQTSTVSLNPVIPGHFPLITALARAMADTNDALGEPLIEGRDAALSREAQWLDRFRELATGQIIAQGLSGLVSQIYDDYGIRIIDCIAERSAEGRSVPWTRRECEERFPVDASGQSACDDMGQSDMDWPHQFVKSYGSNTGFLGVFPVTCSRTTCRFIPI